jgi:hypothetical protein
MTNVVEPQGITIGIRSHYIRSPEGLDDENTRQMAEMAMTKVENKEVKLTGELQLWCAKLSSKIVDIDRDRDDFVQDSILFSFGVHKCRLICEVRHEDESSDENEDEEDESSDEGEGEEDEEEEEIEEDLVVWFW